ncbi:HAD superfamily hydrolase (TIGR01509 family) [Arthrobacter pigmenti]|uniref:HAD superfamily hydrolase (TIGR01509 family) n=1 Tax=Arthrobacter pigmenti TaxID=271432 RepID=A0A846RMT7_9MICC|nr:HAD family hydrolase [Arthrobacter pigmenti]NJC21447.1 HAD superfamily hydrolase (TIGR01509 family) [Arthrobacter pigmenti]
MAEQHDDDGKRGVLFDVDGTLVDTNYLHAVAWWQTFRRFGHDVPMSAIHRTIGMGGTTLIEHLLGTDRETGQDDAIKDTHAALFSAQWPSLRAFDGARDLLLHCADSGLAVVLATSASEEELAVLRQVLDAEAALIGATNATDTGISKPSPDILEAALETAGLKPDEAVFVGDAVWDVIAANKLGMPTLAVTTGGTSEAELRDAGAARVYRDVRELLNAIRAGDVPELIKGARQ